jgi:Flp pilus assembly protein TadD
MNHLFRPRFADMRITVLGLVLLGIWGCNRPAEPVSPAKSPRADQVASDDDVDGGGGANEEVKVFEPEVQAPSTNSTDSVDSSDPSSAGIPSQSASTNRGGDGFSRGDETEITDPIQLRDEALQALDSGDTETALKRMRRLQSIAPLDHESTFLMARVLAERNRFAEAIWMLDELAEQVPDLALPVIGQTAEWMVFNGQWEEAEKRYQTLREVADGPLAMIVDRMLAQLFLRQGRRQEAADHLRSLCRFGDVNEGELRALLNIPHPLPNESIDEAELQPIGAMGRARYQICQGNWQEAADELTASPREHVGHVALLGRIHAQQQDFAALETWASEVPEDEKVAADHWVALASLQVHQEDFPAAVKSCCEAILRDQTDHEAYRLLSVCLEELGNSDQAKAVSTRADTIRRTQEIGNDMAGSQTPLPDQIVEVAKLLEELQRPFESLAWQAIQIIYQQSAGKIDQKAAMQELGQINAQRMRLLQSEQPTATRQFILCGIDPQTL